MLFDRCDEIVVHAAADGTCFCAEIDGVKTALHDRLPRNAAPDHGLTGSYSEREVGFGDIAIDLLGARFRAASGSIIYLKLVCGSISVRTEWRSRKADTMSGREDGCVVCAINAQLVRASETKCRPPYRALFRASLATAGLSLHVPHRTRQLVVEVPWMMRREYCERP